VNFHAGAKLRGLDARSRNQREAIRVLDGIDVQVDIHFRPVKMLRLRPFDMKDLADRRILESGEPCKRHEQFLIVEQQPEAVPGNVGDLNRRNVCAKRRR
jgi:hypothetical protein